MIPKRPALDDPGRRLIQENDGRFVDDGAGQSQPLLKTARQVGRPPPGPAFQVEEAEEPDLPGPSRSGGRPVMPPKKSTFSVAVRSPYRANWHM